MKAYELHPSARKVFDSLAEEYKQAFINHQYEDDIDDFLAELALAQIAGKTPSQARSAARRFAEGGQAPRKMLSFDSIIDNRDEIDIVDIVDISHVDDIDIDEKKQDVAADTGELLPDIDTNLIAQKYNVTRRRAQQIVKKQIERAKMCGDLFIQSADGGHE